MNLNIDLKKLIENSLPGLLTAGLIAFATMTFQFAQMRTELVGLRRDITRIESLVTALVTREQFHRGDEEVVELGRIARAIDKSKQAVASGLKAAQ